MALVILGLLASVGLYLIAIYGIAWSSSRRIKAAENYGATVDAQLSFPSATEIFRRHSVEWAIGFAILFVILAVADFPFWQRLGIAGVLAIVFGSMWLAQSEPGEAAEAAPSIHGTGSNIWYWLLAVGDWFGFLAVLCFATEVLARAL
jgi:hypothetical protein